MASISGIMLRRENNILKKRNKYLQIPVSLCEDGAAIVPLDGPCEVIGTVLGPLSELCAQELPKLTTGELLIVRA